MFAAEVECDRAVSDAEVQVQEEAVRLPWLSLALGILIATAACGGGGDGGGTPAQSGSLSGNWQISLARHVNPVPPVIYTGFLVQSGDSIAGNLLFYFPTDPLTNCSGLVPITGTVDNGDLSMTIDEFGEQVSLQGTSSPMSGEFSNVPGGCTAYANSGTWSAVQIAPLAGSFHGTFTSTVGNGTINVTGTLEQGPNTGAGSASLSGNLTASGSSFCSYLSSATITGLISGTTVELNLYGPNGSEITQVGQVGEINNTNIVPSPGVCSVASPQNGINGNPCLLVTPDGTSLTGNYYFPSPSAGCLADQGTVSLTLP